jgi:hypothetical protein
MVEVTCAEATHLRASHLQSCTLLLELHLQSILLWLFWKWGCTIYLPGLASNRNLPDLSLPNWQNYRCEPSEPGSGFPLMLFSILQRCLLKHPSSLLDTFLHFFEHTAIADLRSSALSLRDGFHSFPFCMWHTLHYFFMSYFF